jgi:hypothetical protein
VEKGSAERKKRQGRKTREDEGRRRREGAKEGRANRIREVLK